MKASILAALLLAGCATALDRPEPGTSLLRGRVDAAMLQHASAELARGQRHFVIDSHGGYLLHARLVGQLLATTEGVTLQARGHCLSACALVLFSVRERSAQAGTAVAFHDARNPAASAIAAGYLRRMGVPEDAIAGYVGTVNVRPLEQAELQRLGVRIVQ